VAGQAAARDRGVSAALVAAGLAGSAAPAAGAPAVAAAPPRLSVRDALATAAARQPALASARAALAGADARATAARALLFPQLNVAADLSATNAPTRISRTGSAAGGGGASTGATGGASAGGGQRGFRQNFSTNATLEQAVFRPRLSGVQTTRPLAIAFVGGLAVAALRTLVVIPNLYLLAHRGRERLAEHFGRGTKAEGDAPRRAPRPAAVGA
jgi:hypothetical protein